MAFDIGAFAKQAWGTLWGSLKPQIDEYLAEDKVAAAWLEAKQAEGAEVAAALATATDPDVIDDLKKRSASIVNAINLELDDIAERLRPEGVAILKVAAAAIGKFLLQNLPTILALIPK